MGLKFLSARVVLDSGHTGGNEQRGFTLVELLVALCLASFVAIGIAETMIKFANNSQRLRNSVDANTDLKSAGAALTQTLSQASISGAFMHLPVPVGNCDSTNNDGPCIQTLNPKTNLFSASAILPAPLAPTGTTLTLTSLSGAPLIPTTWWEFFRDDDADLPFSQQGITPFTPPAPAAAPGDNPAVLSSIPISVPESIVQGTDPTVIANGPYYLTWTLNVVQPTGTPPDFTVPKSPPFLVLISQKDAGNATLSGYSGAPGAGAVNFVSPTALANPSFVLSFNSTAPSQYVISQYTPNGAGANGTVAPLDVAGPISKLLNPVGSPAIQGMGNYRTPAVYAGLVTPWDWTGVGGSKNQGNFLYFPTDVASVFNSLAADSIYYASPVNPASLIGDPALGGTGIGGAWTSSGLDAPLSYTVTPIQIVSYALAINSRIECTLPGKTVPTLYSNRLVEVSWNWASGNEIAKTVLDKVCSQVIFARKIGSKTLSFFVF